MKSFWWSVNISTTRSHYNETSHDYFVPPADVALRLIREIRAIRVQKKATSAQFVPFLSAECITFVPANNVRKDSGEIRTLAVGKARETFYEVKAGRFYEVKAGRLYEVKAIF